jgi:hypothetical protein
MKLNQTAKRLAPAQEEMTIGGAPVLLTSKQAEGVKNTAVLFEEYVLNILSIKLQLSALLLLVFADENCPR